MTVKMETEATMLPAQERKPQETIDSRSRGDVPLRWLTSILLLIFPTATLFLNRGDSYVLGLLTLVGIWVWLRDSARRWLDRPSALLWIAFVLFFAVALLSYLLGAQTDAGFRFLGRYLRFLLIAPVYLALRRYPPTAKTVFIGLAVGALLAGMIGGLHFLHAEGAIRVEATTGLSIIFGDLTATMTLCTVAAFVLFGMSRKNWTTSLMVLCVAGGIAATLLSGTRGAWIPLLLLLPILITRFGGFLSGRYAFAIIFVLTAVFSSFYLVSSSGTHVRIADARTGLRNYLVALQYLDAGGGGTSQESVCVNQENFLKAWLELGRTASGTLDAAVLTDPSLAHVGGCMTDYVVRLHNPGNAGVAQQIFSRIPRHGASGQHTELLMRGMGTIDFTDGKGKSMASVNSPTYLRYSLVDRTAAGEQLNVFVAPGRTTWLVPLDSYPGEYSLSIADNSAGQRLELWRGAWMIFLQHPVIGAGVGAFQNKVEEIINQGRVAGFARNYDHPHNDYLNALSSSGIVGLVILLGILVLPIWHFSRRIRSGERGVRAVSMAGSLTVMGFAIYALTDTIFLHSMMITWYVVYMALFYALLAAQDGRLTKLEPPKQ